LIPFSEANNEQALLCSILEQRLQTLNVDSIMMPLLLCSDVVDDDAVDDENGGENFSFALLIKVGSRSKPRHLMIVVVVVVILVSLLQVVPFVLLVAYSLLLHPPLSSYIIYYFS
jgi:hypothetical protein